MTVSLAYYHHEEVSKVQRLGVSGNFNFRGYNFQVQMRLGWELTKNLLRFEALRESTVWDLAFAEHTTQQQVFGRSPVPMMNPLEAREAIVRMLQSEKKVMGERWKAEVPVIKLVGDFRNIKIRSEEALQ
jgi:hypothetical protein